MKKLYITSIENFSGKTAVTLALGRRLQLDGQKIAYYKPVSYELMQYGSTMVDEDVLFVRRVLNIQDDPENLFGVLITPDNFKDCIGSDADCGFEDEIQEEFARVSENKDISLIEGGGSLRQGYAIGLSTPSVAEMLDSQVLVVVKYRSRMRVLDDALTAQFRLKGRLAGVIINRVPEDELDYVKKDAIPFLEKEGISVYGMLPEQDRLASIGVEEIRETVEGRFLVGEENADRLVSELVIGAQGARESLSRFRLLQNKAVITSGDRTDIQLAALETSTACLVLTGNLNPSLTVVEQASEQGVPIVITRYSTMGAIEAVENVFGKTRLQQAEKLAFFEALMAENVDFKRLFGDLKDN